MHALEARRLTVKLLDVTLGGLEIAPSEDSHELPDARAVLAHARRAQLSHRPLDRRTGLPLVSHPPIILRKRNQAGMVRIYDAIIRQLSQNAEAVPAGWIGLVEDGDDQEATGEVNRPGFVGGSNS